MQIAHSIQAAALSLYVSLKRAGWPAGQSYSAQDPATGAVINLSGGVASPVAGAKIAGAHPMAYVFNLFSGKVASAGRSWGSLKAVSDYIDPDTGDYMYSDSVTPDGSGDDSGVQGYVDAGGAAQFGSAPAATPLTGSPSVNTGSGGTPATVAGSGAASTSIMSTLFGSSSGTGGLFGNALTALNAVSPAQAAKNAAPVGAVTPPKASAPAASNTLLYAGLALVAALFLLKKKR